MGKDFPGGLSRVKSKETSNHPQGRVGSKVKLKPGPATGRTGGSNPTRSGGINRPLKGGR